MALFSRYIFRQTVAAFVLIMLSLTGVVWIATALKQLTLLTSQGQSPLVFLTMTALSLPTLAALTAPIALLIATIYTLNRLNGDSELIVMTAAGATIWSFARPLLTIAGGLTIVLLVANHLLLPWSVRSLQHYVVKVRTDLISQVLQPGEFSAPEPGLTFHMRARGKDGGLLGLVVSDEREPGQSTIYLAERGEIRKEAAASYLIMHQGHILRQTDPAKPAVIISFESNFIDLSELSPKQGTEIVKPRARQFSELIAPAADDPAYLRNPGSFRAELHERFASPLYPVAFALIVIALLGRARTNRLGRVRSLVAAFCLAAVLRVLGLAANNLAALTPAAVVLVYALPLAAIGLSALAAQASMVPRRSGLIERLSEDVVTWVVRLVEQGYRATARHRHHGAR